MRAEYRQVVLPSKTSEVQYTTMAGSAMSPTQRSDTDRQRRRSLDGVWRDNFLWSATKITEFPRNAQMDRKMFSTIRHTSWCCIPSANSGAQYRSRGLLSVVCFSRPVKFAVIVIFLLCEGALWRSFSAFLQSHRGSLFWLWRLQIRILSRELSFMAAEFDWRRVHMRQAGALEPDSQYLVIRCKFAAWQFRNLS